MYKNDGYNIYFKSWRSLLQANLKTTVRTVISHIEDHYYRQIWKQQLEQLFHTLKSQIWKWRFQQLFHTLNITITGKSENYGYNSYLKRWRSLLQANLKTTVIIVIWNVEDHNYRQIWKQRLQPLFYTLKITVTGTYEKDGYNSYFKRWRSLLQANLKTTVTTVISHTEDHYYRQIENDVYKLFYALKNSITGTYENDGYNSYFKRWRSLLQANL